MTHKQFTEIQASASACESYYMSPLGEQVITQDVPALAEEVARLEAENVALKARVAALAAVYARFKHMDGVLSDPRFNTTLHEVIVRDLWLAIKAAMEPSS